MRDDVPKTADLQPTDRLDSVLGAERVEPASLSLVVVRDGETSTYPLPRAGRLVIGRSSRADIRIEHTSVSREHAALHLGPTTTVEDLGSANRTRVRDVPLTAGVAVEIYPDDVVDLGAVLLVLQYRSLSERPRRACHPSYFDLRMEEELERAARGEPAPTLAELEIDGGPSAHALQLIIASALRPTDLLTTRAAQRYELLLVDAAGETHEARLACVLKQLRDRGMTVRMTAGASAPRATPPPENAPSARDVSDRVATHVVARDPAMVRIVRLLERVADRDLSVLLLGETGVGKEVCAELLHRLSTRADKPFVPLNCAAFPESLLDSELFGHVRGAFTGATSDKIGLLESANGGTVLLDEIGDMPLSTQVRLLRVLESREATRVGATKPRPIDIRVIAATHHDLAELITAGRFREDLYYRINGIAVVVPPLRERIGDIGPLARHFALRFARGPLDVSPDALRWLEAQPWTGNVRELRNAIERAVALCDGPTLLASHLVRDEDPARGAPSAGAPASLRDEVHDLERERIVRALEECGGNQRRAASTLGISRGALLRRIAQHGLRRS